MNLNRSRTFVIMYSMRNPRTCIRVAEREKERESEKEEVYILSSFSLVSDGFIPLG